VPPKVSAAVMRQGLRVIGVAIKVEPRVFAVAVAASALYGVMTVGSSWALGWATEHVVLPSFREGRTTTGALLIAALLIVGTAVFKAIGIAARRILAGAHQYRMQAWSRRAVTRQYLRLPLAWHHRHPTGQLLSNASSDAEAAWGPLAPLPMAVGVVVMLVTAAGAILIIDPALAVVGFLIFPAIAVLNFVYQRRLSPLATRAQQLRAKISEIAHESFDGALVVKTLGREEAETARFQAGAEELRDANIAVGRVRGLFDPLLEALPTLGVLIVLFVGSIRLESGDVLAGELVQVAYLFTLLAFPVRALGWVLGELPCPGGPGRDRFHGVRRRPAGSLAAPGRPRAGRGALRLRPRRTRDQGRHRLRRPGPHRRRGGLHRFGQVHACPPGRTADRPR
jgi:ATP-binding cassette subfamily B protein